MYLKKIDNGKKKKKKILKCTIELLQDDSCIEVEAVIIALYN